MKPMLDGDLANIKSVLEGGWGADREHGVRRAEARR
jgi:hypothetical protein